MTEKKIVALVGTGATAQLAALDLRAVELRCVAPPGSLEVVRVGDPDPEPPAGDTNARAAWRARNFLKHYGATDKLGDLK